MTHKFLTAADAALYVMAGNAIITLSSLKTGARYTYKVSRAKAKPGDRLPAPWFVALLTGPNNESDYTYLGMITSTQGFRVTKASKLSVETAPVKAFIYFYEQVVRAGKPPPSLEIRHEGSCGRCGRALTVPESIDRGIGPECWGKLGGLPSAERAAIVGEPRQVVLPLEDAALVKARPSRSIDVLPLSQTGFFGDKPVLAKGAPLNDPLPEVWRA